jgi:hypothetical protein
VSKRGAGLMIIAPEVWEQVYCFSLADRTNTQAGGGEGEASVWATLVFHCLTNSSCSGIVPLLLLTAHR